MPPGAGGLLLAIVVLLPLFAACSTAASVWMSISAPIGPKSTNPPASMTVRCASRWRRAHPPPSGKIWTSRADPRRHALRGLRVRVDGLDNRLAAAGSFSLAPSMTLREIVETLATAQAAALQHHDSRRLARRASRRLSEPQRAAGRGRRTASYREKATSGDLTGLELSRYPFLQDHQRAGLEGYLFPDTYLLPAELPAALDVLARQLDTFQRRASSRSMPRRWRPVQPSFRCTRC